MKITRIVLINLAVFSGLIASLEISLNIARHFKRVNKIDWEFFFHPGVGHSHQKSQFIQNANTSKLIHDNISADTPAPATCVPSDDELTTYLSLSSY